MPQLLSRRDNSGWLTPSMADIIVQGTTPLPGEDTLREQINEIQQRLANLDTPIRVLDVRPSPSHNLYIARPEAVRRGRKSATVNDIRRNLGQVSEDREDWTLGFISQLPEDPESFGILLRTAQHQPMRLRQVLLSNTFQHHNSTFVVALGVTLEKQVVVQDIQRTAPLLVIGPENSRRHLIRATLLTLAMLNTPSELRIALLGESSKSYEELIRMPHALGRLIDSPENGQRLLEGMAKEVQRRHQWLAERTIDDLDTYNLHLEDQGEPPLPRILLVFSSISDIEWQAARDSWQDALYDILVNGSKVGIYTLLTVDALEHIPESLDPVIDTHIIMRSAGAELVENISHLHGTALRFVDAFVLSQRNSDAITPIELTAVSDQDMQNLVRYWQQLAVQRSQETRPRERTGLTDLLPDLEGSGLGQQESSRPAAGALPTRTRAGALARATQVLSGEGDERLVAQAMTLAAYLGWIGIGPIRDIFGVSTGEARAVIAALQSLEAIEDGSGPIYRFLRLADNPIETGVD